MKYFLGKEAFANLGGNAYKNWDYDFILDNLKFAFKDILSKNFQKGKYKSNKPKDLAYSADDIKELNSKVKFCIKPRLPPELALEA